MQKAVLMGCLGVSCCCGCSFLFVTSPPSDVEKLPPSEPVECTTSKAAPIIDTIVAGYQVVRTGYALSKTDADYNGAPISRNADIGFGVGLAVLFTAASIYGYSTTSECAEVKERQQRRRLELNANDTQQSTFTFSPRQRANPSPPAEPSTVAPAPDQNLPAASEPVPAAGATP